MIIVFRAVTIAHKGVFTAHGGVNHRAIGIDLLVQDALESGIGQLRPINLACARVLEIVDPSLVQIIVKGGTTSIGGQIISHVDACADILHQLGHLLAFFLAKHAGYISVNQLAPVEGGFVHVDRQLSLVGDLCAIRQGDRRTLVAYPGVLSTLEFRGILMILHDDGSGSSHATCDSLLFLSLCVG